MLYDAWMSKKYNKDIIECLACNHNCKIQPDKTGICGVRLNKNGKLKILVYGKASAINTDPIEKKPLFHFYPNSQIFSIGTVGCNFRCEFCQNWDLSQFHKSHTIKETQESGKKLKPQDIIDLCIEKKIPAIAFTYNEPAIFFEYAYDTAKLAHENNIKTVYVSNGFETRKALEKIHPYLDAINVDIKSFNQDYYQKICGGKIEPVKENIKWIWDQGIWEEVTTLIVTNHNDSDEELKEIANFLYNISPDIPWHISRYHPAYKMDDPPTPLETLEKAYNIGKKAGLNHVYIGNINAPGKENTYCPNCNKVLIERSGFNAISNLKGNKCPNCKNKISGRF